ncbi:glycoside hydrolase family 2 TIM barrel-domain containing protein [Microbacterium sp. ARD31]|uniref:glycoside hydrolase family 2 TIM barrel-domain containing protein n=1 Tax=Microbacterium sp. ARD31 TaxID=2962576 RepID=UPI002881A70D|nr:glycoside hydrolase family 2 TIM barrel-domain containing protein [Microbacterium sp. ARD31]MDT0184029.1 glycoside hydrolase family 2 TIM barrel-domain containing protein [Microbacterium sp. ARD31]
MATAPFTRGWELRRERDVEYTRVDLPHDAMIGERRSAGESSWAHGAYFPGGTYRYRKVWTPGSEITGKEVALRFEGIYRRSRVMLDGRAVGGSPSGYREFEVRLDPHLREGVEHTIEVAVDNAQTPNARWYTGSGIYRPVWLEVRDRVHLVEGGLAVRTRLAGSTAIVEIDAAIANPDGESVDVVVTLRRDRDVVGERGAVTGGATAAVDLSVPDAAVWSAESPSLYDLEVVLSVDGVERDRTSRRIGLRTVVADTRRGLLVNGTSVILRGANIHHDSGVLGAATFPAAERRRIRILKDAGFNAIRSAHNPASRALLDACDELGMYVMDEAFDGWYDHKTEHDDADLFEDSWRDDLGSMVAKDRCHPSVIMYSVGNENGEAFSPRGRRTAAAMAAELRRLDPSRLTTIGVNLVGAAFAGLAKSHEKELDERVAKAAPDMTSTALNVISNRFGFLMSRFPKLRGADRATSELFTHFDVAGYNYGTARYEIDAVAHPDRLVIGTETMPGDLARNYALSKRLPTVIGDFVWAGWDYMGEAGGGAWAYGTRTAPFLKPYPQLTSQMGIFDITGVPGAAIRLAQAAWGMLAAPAIAVRPLDVTPGPIARSSWRSTDAIESWSWAGHEGERVEIEIYSDDDEVEVLIEGRSLGRVVAGETNGFLARFRGYFERGTIEAIGYREGRGVSRSQLRTAGPARLRLIAESELEIVGDVVFVRLELADDDGVVDAAASDTIVVRVDGPAVVAGFGSGAPATEESFTDLVHSTYRGRALLALRSTGDTGAVTLTASTRTHGDARLTLSPLDSSRDLRVFAYSEGSHS